jgi:NAD(P)-dependent dehydrogenase (short-subunit alcohol dehydrogenase family)
MVGGTSGIGLELARRFRAAGSTVVVGGRRTDVLAQLAEEGLGIVEIHVPDADSVTSARRGAARASGPRNCRHHVRHGTAATSGPCSSLDEIAAVAGAVTARIGGRQAAPPTWPA